MTTAAVKPEPRQVATKIRQQLPSRDGGMVYLGHDEWKIVLAALAPPAVPESVRRLSEAIQITDACVPGVYQYPVHGDAEWLVGWLFTKPNLDAGTRKVADLARLALEVRNLLAEPGDDEPLTSTDAVRAWEAEQAMAAGEPVTSSDALALWRVEQATPSGRADTPLARGGAVETRKSDTQIVEEVNDVARMVLGIIGTGYTAPEGHKFYAADQKDIRSRRAWDHAVEIYERITKSEVHDALLAVEEDAAAPAAPEPAAGGGREIVRHLKRGTEYEVLGEAEAQVANGNPGDLGQWLPVRDGSRLTVYRCLKTGKLWCRFTDEFRDGRFETISAPSEAETAGGDGWQDIETAAKKSRPSIIIESEIQRYSDFKTKSEFLAHWAEDLSGSEQPPFRGWFYDNGFGFVQVPGTPKRWRHVSPTLATAGAEGGQA